MACCSAGGSVYNAYIAVNLCTLVITVTLENISLSVYLFHLVISINCLLRNNLDD